MTPLDFTNDECAGSGRDNLVVLPKFGTAMTGFPAPHHDAAKALQRTQPRRAVKLHGEIHGRRKLPEVERCRQRRAHGVVEHRREESALHVAGRVEKHLDRFKAGFDGTALAVDLDKPKTEGLRAWRRRQRAVDHFPEERILVHDAALAVPWLTTAIAP